MNLTTADIDTIEDWWIEKSRVNFFAYRRYMREGDFVYNWFIEDLCKQLHQFYKDFVDGKRPVLLIQTPPQHGKSWTIADFIAWMSGKIPKLRSIYATYSDTLGKRCNLAQQRTIDSEKYKKIFPNTQLTQKRGKILKNTELLEFVNEKGTPTSGQFRNTTVAGSVTGESLDLGVIDDAVKGREQANSISISQKIWEWFTDDFKTRFSELSGLIVIMTRWSTHDIIARLIEKFKDTKRKLSVVNYQALATKDEEYRKADEALFPQLKSKEFLLEEKALKSQASWESLYQGNPTITGGDKFKDHWWKWWKTGHLPPIKYKFITADTAQKDKDKHDWSVFQCWGMGIDSNLYLLDKLRGKFTAPVLRREAELFYNKHNTPRINLTDPILRGMYIEDKSSGTGLIQELEAKKVKVVEIPRVTDKNMRADDSAPSVQAGRVYLNTDISGVDNLTKEAREYPNCEFDDDIDTLMTAIEVAFLNGVTTNSLQAAMEAA
jgi:predicted phage terminase large subunit-like protein